MPIVELNYRQTPENVQTSGYRSRLSPELSCVKSNNKLNRQRTRYASDNIYAVKSISAGARILSSCQGNQTNGQSLSLDTNEYSRSVCSHGNKLLVHHPRHSLKSRFHVLKTLGEGTYGKVKLATDKSTREHVAVKYIRKTKIQDENDQAQIKREIKILSNLKHKHIVNIREVFEKKDKIVLVMDYAPGGELYDYLAKMGRLAETEARRIFRQIVSAVHHCHENGIVHRDLKLENIVLDDVGNVKIADFGLSNYFSPNTNLTTFCGSPLYASPEIVNGQPYHGPEVDVWSMGVILYTLVYGAMPFESPVLCVLKLMITTGNYIQRSPPSDAAGLIRHMLTANPSRRASLEDVLCHWWVNLGYPDMANGRPYSPGKELPHETPILATERKDSLEHSCVLDHSCSSSNSSDSDVELDSKHNLKIYEVGDNRSNSDSSCEISSDFFSRINKKSNCSEEVTDTAALSSALLTLPPGVLKILTECSDKTLSAFMSSDKLSSAIEKYIKDKDNNVLSQKIEEFFQNDNLVCARTSISGYDSQKKPTKGILKRNGKFSDGDGSCITSEDIVEKSVDIPVQELGDLSLRLQSLVVDSDEVFNVHKGDCYSVDNSLVYINAHSKNAKTFVSMSANLT